MPKDVTKQRFNNFKKYYDPEIFLEAGRKIREKASLADGMRITERIRHITQIFDTFRNPDKETVLTPWRVVNMHLSDCIGGFDFFDVTHTEKQLEPRFVDHGAVTNRIFMSEKCKILELNSKSGLYPLYMAYSIFKNVKEPEWRKIELTEERGHSRDAEQYYHQAGNDLLIWRDVLQDNIEEIEVEGSVLEIMLVAYNLKKKHDMIAKDDKTLQTMLHWQHVNGFSDEIFDTYRYKNDTEYLASL